METRFRIVHKLTTGFVVVVLRQGLTMSLALLAGNTLWPPAQSRSTYELGLHHAQPLLSFVKKQL